MFTEWLSVWILTLCSYFIQKWDFWLTQWLRNKVRYIRESSQRWHTVLHRSFLKIKSFWSEEKTVEIIWFGRLFPNGKIEDFDSEMTSSLPICQPQQEHWQMWGSRPNVFSFPSHTLTPTYLVLSLSPLKMWNGIGYLKFHSKFFLNMPGKLALLWQWLLRTFFSCLTEDCRWPHVAGCETSVCFWLRMIQSSSHELLMIVQPVHLDVSELQRGWLRKKFRRARRQLQYHLLMNGTIFLVIFFLILDFFWIVDSAFSYSLLWLGWTWTYSQWHIYCSRSVFNTGSFLHIDNPEHSWEASFRKIAWLENKCLRDKCVGNSEEGYSCFIRESLLSPINDYSWDKI